MTFDFTLLLALIGDIYANIVNFHDSINEVFLWIC